MQDHCCKSAPEHDVLPNEGDTIIINDKTIINVQPF
jgi:hypothetical protein